MSLELALVILSLLTGTIYALDILFWSKKRIEGVHPNKLIELSRSFFPIFFIVLMFRSFFIEPFRIPSGSLEPTLRVGDFVAVSKFAYGFRLPVLHTKILTTGEPKRGDIAVFRWPPNPDIHFIKRVIGIPGDTIAYKNKVLYVNGQEVKQHFVRYEMDESSGVNVKTLEENLSDVKHKIYINDRGLSFDFETIVPQGQYFVMGDNRDFSADSRYWGFVKDEYLLGRAFFVWMSWNPYTWLPRWSSIGRVIH